MNSRGARRLERSTSRIFHPSFSGSTNCRPCRVVSTIRSIFKMHLLPGKSRWIRFEKPEISRSQREKRNSTAAGTKEKTVEKYNAKTSTRTTTTTAKTVYKILSIFRQCSGRSLSVFGAKTNFWPPPPRCI